MAGVRIVLQEHKDATSYRARPTNATEWPTTAAAAVDRGGGGGHQLSNRQGADLCSLAGRGAAGIL